MPSQHSFFFLQHQAHSVLHFLPNSNCFSNGGTLVLHSTLRKALPFEMALFAAYPIKHSSQMSFWRIGQLSFQWHWLHSTVRGWECGGWRSEKTVRGISRRFVLQHSRVGGSPSEIQFFLWSRAELNSLHSFQV